MSNVAGNYHTSGDSPFGMQESDIEFIVDGDVLTGTFSVLDAIVPIENGKVSGDEFSFILNATTPMGKFKLKTSGKVDGDAISGVMKHPLAKIDFSGSRV